MADLNCMSDPGLYCSNAFTEASLDTTHAFACPGVWNCGALSALYFLASWDLVHFFLIPRSWVGSIIWVLDIWVHEHAFIAEIYAEISQDALFSLSPRASSAKRS